MSKVVYFGYSASGHINPTLGVVRELVSKGESVYYYSIPDYKNLIETTGAQFRDDLSIDFINKHIINSNVGKLDPVDEFIGFVITNITMGRSIINSIIDEVKEINPDYIMHDSFCSWGKELAQILNKPAISSITIFALNNEIIETDPVGLVSNLIRINLAADEDLDARRIYKKLWSRVSKIAGRIVGQEDFDLIDTFINKEELNIVFTSKEFQIYPDTFDESFSFLGPSIEFRSNSKDFPYEKQTDNPVIYISLGTIYNKNTEFYRKCFEAFGDIDKQVVLSIGNATCIDSLGDIPDNFLVMNHVPQIEILKHSGVFITHGGMNSVNEGIYNNVPLIVFPQNADQFLVASQVEKLGVGVYIKNQDITAAELRKITIDAYMNTEFLNKCNKISESFIQSNRCKNASDDIMNFKSRKGIID